MTQQQILAHLAAQTVPQSDDQITARFGVKLTAAALVEDALLILLYDGFVWEPLGEFRGWAISDTGREELKRLSKPETKKREQMQMF